MLTNNKLFESRRIATNRDASATQSRHLKNNSSSLENYRIATSRQNRDIATQRKKYRIMNFYYYQTHKKMFCKNVCEKRRDVAIHYTEITTFSRQSCDFLRLLEGVAIASRCVAIRHFLSRFAGFLGVLWFLV